MNFEFFESLTLEQARDHLREFIGTESAAWEGMRSAAQHAGVTMDYSVVSLSPFLKWIVQQVQVVRIPVPASEPKWIREAHKDGLIDFEQESKSLILRAAYYLGETFVRSHPSLGWTTGNPEYLEKNMPVVAGFRSGLEMSPNLQRRPALPPLLLRLRWSRLHRRRLLCVPSNPRCVSKTLLPKDGSNYVALPPPALSSRPAF